MAIFKIEEMDNGLSFHDIQNYLWKILVCETD